MKRRRKRNAEVSREHERRRVSSGGDEASLRRCWFGYAAERGFPNTGTSAHSLTPPGATVTLGEQWTHSHH